MTDKHLMSAKSKLTGKKQPSKVDHMSEEQETNSSSSRPDLKLVVLKFGVSLVGTFGLAAGFLRMQKGDVGDLLLLFLVYLFVPGIVAASRGVQPLWVYCIGPLLGSCIVPFVAFVLVGLLELRGIVDNPFLAIYAIGLALLWMLLLLVALFDGDLIDVRDKNDSQH